ncbi:hypothetical protein V6N13_010702 [Hibiscus sabdariffa]
MGKILEFEEKGYCLRLGLLRQGGRRLPHSEPYFPSFLFNSSKFSSSFTHHRKLHCKLNMDLVTSCKDKLHIFE